MLLFAKVKATKCYKNILFNYEILNLMNLIKTHKIIIFFNYNQLLIKKNINLTQFKNDLFKEHCISLVLNKKHINKIFTYDFQFLSASIFCIFIDDILKFFNILKLLKNIYFFFSFNNRFSNISTNTIIIDQYKKYKNNLFVHFIIFSLLFNIIILLLYFITAILKYIKI